MRRLILMRHAKSDWNPTGRTDHDRPLNRRGRTSAKAMGIWLRETRWLPDEVLCSDAVRTRQTLAGIELPDGTPTRFLADLYHAEAQAMLDRLRACETETVLMIGHNPGCCALAHDLVKTPPEHDRFDDYPTCATLVAEFDVSDWRAVAVGTASVADFVVPREVIAARGSES